MMPAGQSPPGPRMAADDFGSRQREAEAESSSGEEDSSEAATESSSDEDQQPLAQRGWAAKHALPQPTAPARTRHNRFPKIPKSERCGTCENCMNPQRKKACVVARRRMEERQQQKQKGGGGDSAPLAPAAVAEDPFTRSLTGILSSSGGVVQERHLALLLQLIKRAQTKPHRTALLVVLQLSAAEVLRRAVAGRVLLDLQLWLNDFVAEGSQPMVQKTLACLDKLPVTLAALQPPCELGKLVGRLRKHASFGSPVIEPAKRLVARWKAMVDGAVKAGGGGGDVSASGPPPKPGAAAARPAAAPAKLAAAAGSATLERQASGNVAVMADGDLFGTTDRQRSGFKDAAPATKKVVTIKTIAVEAIAGKPGASQVGASAAGATGRAAGGVDGKPGSGSSAPITIAGQAGLSRVGASPFSVLGSPASGVTMLGGNSSGSLGMPLTTVGPSSSSAKDRAAAAARRVPSPEPAPQPRKEKKKKVVWEDAEALIGVRWFLKDDPPAAAQQDADLAQAPAASGNGAAAPTAAAAAAAPEAQPPGFESAAKKEHLSEAEALRRHRAEEDQERIELQQRLALMVPTTAWLNPLTNDCMSDADLAAMPAPPARGEDSLEAAEAAVRRQQVPAALYANAAAIPDSPAEPSAVADHGVAQHPADIARIPLSLEEAASMQQQLQQTMAAADALGRQQLAHQLPAQQQQVPVANIGAALAQLAASGVLTAVGSGPPGGGQPMQRHQQHQHQLQPAMRQGQHVPGQGWWQGSQQHHPQQQEPYQGQQHPGPAPSQRWVHNQRACHYFNTPKGCFHGDRCKFAHIAPSGGGGSGGVKRPAEGGAGTQQHSQPNKHQRV